MKLEKCEQEKFKDKKTYNMSIEKEISFDGTRDIDLLIEFTSQRIRDLHKYYPLDSVEFDKMYLNNIRALSLLCKIKKDLKYLDNKKLKIDINYDEILKQIINS